LVGKPFYSHPRLIGHTGEITLIDRRSLIVTFYICAFACNFMIATAYSWQLDLSQAQRAKYMRLTVVELLIALSAILICLLVAYVLQRYVVTHGPLFTGKPTRGKRILALLCSVLFSGFLALIGGAEMLAGELLAFFGGMIVALVAYGFGLTPHLLRRIQTHQYSSRPSRSDAPYIGDTHDPH
jgi:putative flippase GtrA